MRGDKESKTGFFVRATASASAGVAVGIIGYSVVMGVVWKVVDKIRAATGDAEHGAPSS